MTTITVTTQAELDAALKKAKKSPASIGVLIDSPAGVWLTLSDTGEATVSAYGSATVSAYGSATVRASGSATVRAYGSATVSAYGSATVRASGSATVSAYDSATVRASTYVAVHLHSTRVTLDGGVVIDATRLDAGTAGQDHGRPTTYTVGQDTTAPDWRDDNDCGGGLHASPHPHQALAYRMDAVRMFEVTVPLTDLRPIPGGAAKAKARTLSVVREVTLTGDPLPEAVAR